MEPDDDARETIEAIASLVERGFARVVETCDGPGIELTALGWHVVVEVSS